MTPGPGYPALSFLRKVEMWQKDQTGTAAGLAVALPGDEEMTLARLLARVADLGPSAHLETQARWWLTGYQEMNPPLTVSQRAELSEALAGIRADRSSGQARHGWEVEFPGLGRVLAVIAAVIAVAVIALTITYFAARPDGGPPPGGTSQQQQQQVPPQLTDLQQFRADWNAPAAATASAGNPAGLVLLQDGLYYPVPWTLPAGDPGWQTDTSGSITGTPVVHGDQVDVTDSDGTTWTVGAGQPFTLSSNLQFVFRVLRDGTIQSMPQPHAIRVRKHL